MVDTVKANVGVLGGAAAGLMRLTADAKLDIARGLVDGIGLVSKFGRSADVPNGSWGPVSEGGLAWFPTVASAVRIKAGGNAIDTAAGDGMRSVIAIGLDANWDLQEVEIATNGASASDPTTETFIRIFRLKGGDVGLYGANNEAAITLEVAAGGTDIITMVADEGQSQAAHYSVPRLKTGYLLRRHASVPSSKSADVRAIIREGGDVIAAPFKPARVIHIRDDVDANVDVSYEVFQTVPGKSDIWVEAKAGAANVEVAAEFDMYLVDDPS